MRLNRSENHSRKYRQRSVGYLFILPYVILLLAFGVAPTMYAIVISFLDTNSAVPGFVGLANYQSALTDFRFPAALGNVVAFMALWLPIMVIGVGGLSLLLHARLGRFTETMRMLYYLPGAVAGSASVLLWLFMFTPGLSPFGPLFKLFGLNELFDVLGPSRMPLALAIMTFSTSAGFWIIVVFGALQGIPKEILEAATVDGASEVQTALSIKLPLVARYLVLMVILSFAGGFQLFVEPQVIFTASLKSLGSQTWSLNQLAYDYAFKLGNFSVSAALSVGLLAVSLVAALGVIYRTDFYRTDSTEP